MPKKITDKGNGRYRLMVSLGYNQAGKQILRCKTISAKSISEAELKWAEFKLSLGQTKGKAMKMKDYINYYVENYERQQLAISTVERNKRLSTRIIATFGNKAIDKIQAKDILLFLNTLKMAGESADSILKHYKYCHALFAKAVKWQMIPVNPCEYVDTPKYTRKEKRILSIDDCQKLLAYVDTDAPLIWQCAVYISLFAGVRKGELFGLQFKHVNNTNNTLTIQQEVLYSEELGLYLKPSTKNYKNRTISIPQKVLTLLNERKIEVNAQKKLLANKWLGAKNIENDFIFCNDRGAMSYSQRFSNWLKTFLASHNLPQITPHAFRHMTASYLIAGGVNIKTVSGKLGHSSMQTTMREYTHLIGDTEKETAVVMEKMMNKK